MLVCRAERCLLSGVSRSFLGGTLGWFLMLILCLIVWISPPLLAQNTNPCLCLCFDIAPPRITLISLFLTGLSGVGKSFFAVLCILLQMGVAFSTVFFTWPLDCVACCISLIHISMATLTLACHAFPSDKRVSKLTIWSLKGSWVHNSISESLVYTLWSLKVVVWRKGLKCIDLWLSRIKEYKLDF